MSGDKRTPTREEAWENFARVAGRIAYEQWKRRQANGSRAA